MNMLLNALCLLLQGFPEKAMSKLEDYGFIQSRAKVRGRMGLMLDC
jgi:hypothetical protein